MQQLYKYHATGTSNGVITRTTVLTGMLIAAASYMYFIQTRLKFQSNPFRYNLSDMLQYTHCTARVCVFLCLQSVIFLSGLPRVKRPDYELWAVYDQPKLLHAAVTASFMRPGFIGGDKEILLLSSIIYVVDCITFWDAPQLWGFWRQRWVGFMASPHVGSKHHWSKCLLGSPLLLGRLNLLIG